MALAFFSLVGCSPAAVNPLPLAPGSIHVSEGEAVLVDMDSGSLDITNGNSALVEVSGSGPAAETGDYSLEREGEAIHLIARSSGNAMFQPGTARLQLELRAPEGFTVQVKTGSADVRVHDYRGSVSITSTAGNISAQNVTGKLIFNSNRGNVSVSKVSGETHLMGNYGLLTLDDTHGSMDASTIMGTIRFAGLVMAGDRLHIETDHGPAEIHLTGDSDANVQVATAGGVVSCAIPGLVYNGAVCAGRLGSGAGQVKIRTVSGSITLRQTP